MARFWGELHVFLVLKFHLVSIYISYIKNSIILS
jgi:hypothetical protein